VNDLPARRPRTIAVVAGEASGDRLGASLIAALGREARDDLRFAGVGGPLMEAAGFPSFFPMADIAVNGFMPVIKRLPLLLARIRETAERIVALSPDVAVLIDSPDFNHRVARILRRRAPHIPIVGYVAPTVWAWRPGRAKKIRPLMDHLMAVLPFEPEALARLGGPPTTYVGHPLMERMAGLRPDAADIAARNGDAPVLLVLPGSRSAEVRRHMPVFGEAVSRLRQRFPGLEAVIPVVPHLADAVRAAAREWPVPVTLAEDDAAKLAAFRRARAAIAKSGTVTLELALAGVPMAVAYKVNALEAAAGRIMIKVESASLPNLILGRKLLPEFLHDACTAEALADVIEPLMLGGPEREAQLAGFREVEALMGVGGDSPSTRAARIVLAAMQTLAPPSP
jgi:lipid-A-disaccharide synthase